MKKILDFTNKYNIFYIVTILLLTIFCFNLYKDNIYAPFSDIGREFYIVSQMNEGNVLYKDILNVYAPLGYQINSLITTIFSNNISTFQYIGLFLTLINLIAIFLISKTYTNKMLALAITTLTITTCAFFPSISNWITPYSYSILYALAGFLWSFYFLIRYIKEENTIFLIYSALLTGFSLACKYEYIGFILIIIATIFYKKPEKNIILKSILAFISIPILSLITLLMQGCRIIDLYNSFIFMVKLANSYSIKYFSNFYGFNICIDSIKEAINSINYDLYYIFENIKTGNKTLITNIQANAVSFRFIGYLCIITALAASFKIIKNKEITIIILLLTAIAVSMKCIGSITLEIFGTYFFPIIIIAIIATLYNVKFLKNFNRIFIFCTFAIAFFYFMDNNKLISLMNMKYIETSKGKIKISNIYYDTTNKLITHLKEETTKEDKVLIIPEGALINYITNRKSDNMLFYLIPPNTEIFGTKFTINKIKEHNPKYILYSNIMTYNDFGQTSFINSWGKDIYKELKNDYTKSKTIGEDFQFYVYTMLY